MNYDFDEIIDRRKTNALKMDGFRGYIFHAGPEATFKFADEEFIHMWVADMEFAVAPEICKAIKDWADKRIFGYTHIYDSSYYDAFLAWCRQRYDWEFPKEELVFAPGVVPALIQLLELLVKPGEKIMTLTPAYGQFESAAAYNQIELVRCPLKNTDGYFTINFEEFEKAASDEDMKVLVWCSPHNPTGRVWTEEEIRRVAEIAKRNDLWIISDEIHCDLLRKGQRHIPTAKLMPEYRKLITCMAPSKTFNLAGMMLADIIIRDETLRHQFISRDKSGGFLNPFSVASHMAAFRQGGEWLEQLRTYLDDNFRFVQEYLKKELPEAVFCIPEATYLAWVDFGTCLPEVEDLPKFFADEAGVLLEGGDNLFVGNAGGFVRLNLAMPRARIEEGMRRICDSVRRYKKCTENT